MPAFAKIGDIAGESTDSDHKNWIIIDSMSSPIHRSIPAGAKDQQRARGETTLGDLVVVRNLDKSSVKLQEACANGTFYPVVEVHMCTQVGNKAEPFLKYKLSNVIVSSYSFHGNANGTPIPSEEITLSPTKTEWTYCVVDPETGKPGGSVVGQFDPGKGAS